MPHHTPLFYHDGTERPITRPKDADEQTLHYSGKKKHHTVKNIIVADTAGTIQILIDTYEGRVHDKAIADQTPYALPAASTLIQDLGFYRFAPPDVQVLQPHKKPRQRELSPAQRAENREISQRRIQIEHIIASVKRCRLAKDTICLWKEGVRDQVMAICCSIHNFRIRLLPWPTHK